MESLKERVQRLSAEFKFSELPVKAESVPSELTADISTCTNHLDHDFMTSFLNCEDII